jgi:hypothetical protein
MGAFKPRLIEPDYGGIRARPSMLCKCFCRELYRVSPDKTIDKSRFKRGIDFPASLFLL